MDLAVALVEAASEAASVEDTAVVSEAALVDRITTIITIMAITAHFSADGIVVRITEGAVALAACLELLCFLWCLYLLYL